jgi:diacylglycerol O-acyltransferase / wax synthase
VTDSAAAGIDALDLGTMEPGPLSEEDRAILELEGETIVGHTAKLMILDPGAPSLETLQQLVAQRAAATPQLHWRLGGSPERPVWVEAEAFEPAEHVVAGSEQPLARAELPGAVARIFEQRLDRSRPLWRIDALDLLGGGRALVWRLHHALADGTAAMRFARRLLWDTVEQAGQRVAHGSGGRGDDHAPGDDERRRAHLMALLRREFAESIHRPPFDAEVGRRRAVQLVSVPIDPLHDAARSRGATLNDAVLSLVAGALGRWIEHHHGKLGDVRLRVPVSLHHEGDDAGNRDSFFTIAAPLGEPDALRRLAAIHAATDERKHEHDAETLESLIDGLARISPHLARFAGRLEASPRSFALSVSNVPGPRDPVSVLGSRVEEMFSLAEIGERHALRIAVVSLGGRLGFGFCADPSVVAGLDEMACGIEAEAAALIAATG